MEKTDIYIKLNEILNIQETVITENDIKVNNYDNIINDYIINDYMNDVINKNNYYLLENDLVKKYRKEVEKFSQNILEQVKNKEYKTIKKIKPDSKFINYICSCIYFDTKGKLNLTEYNFINHTLIFLKNNQKFKDYFLNIDDFKIKKRFNIYNDTDNFKKYYIKYENNKIPYIERTTKKSKSITNNNRLDDIDISEVMIINLLFLSVVLIILTAFSMQFM